jgi:VDE lipocalin domain
VVDGATGLVSRVVHQPEDSIAEITFVIEDPRTPSKFGRKSPVKAVPTTVDEAARHLCDKVFWFADGRVTTRIVSLKDPDVDASQLVSTGVLIALGVRDNMESLEAVWKARSERAAAGTGQLCHFAVDCAAPIPSLVGPLNLDGSNAIASATSRLLPWTQRATARRLHAQMSQLFERWTSDDFCSALLLFVNQFVSEVDWVKHSIDATWEKGPVRNAVELSRMVTKCGGCIGRCVADDKCRECIVKLTQVDSRDQVASYQTIVSYESELLRDFSLCILTKNNIFGCDATIPSLPAVAPVRSWRGQPLTEDAARSLMVGHLADPAAHAGGLGLNVSWKVACGANVAYDQFPSQNQLFYPAARGRDMWYDPVFRVQTLDGRSVWCKRYGLSVGVLVFSFCSTCYLFVCLTTLSIVALKALQGPTCHTARNLPAVCVGQRRNVQRVLDDCRGRRGLVVGGLPLRGGGQRRRTTVLGRPAVHPGRESAAGRSAARDMEAPGSNPGSSTRWTTTTRHPGRWRQDRRLSTFTGTRYGRGEPRHCKARVDGVFTVKSVAGRRLC